MTCQCDCPVCNPDPYLVVAPDGSEVEADCVESACVAQLGACRTMTILNDELNALVENGEISEDTHAALAELLGQVADEQAENLEALVARARDEQGVD